MLLTAGYLNRPGERRKNKPRSNSLSIIWRRPLTLVNLPPSLSIGAIEPAIERQFRSITCFRYVSANPLTPIDPGGLCSKERYLSPQIVNPQFNLMQFHLPACLIYSLYLPAFYLVSFCLICPTYLSDLSLSID
jgi:hypothetical protein